MNSWLDMHDNGHHHLQLLLDEAEKQRKIKRAATRPGLMIRLHHSLKQILKPSHAGRLRPLKARE